MVIATTSLSLHDLIAVKRKLCVLHTCKQSDQAYYSKCLRDQSNIRKDSPKSTSCFLWLTKLNIYHDGILQEATSTLGL